MTRGSQSIPCLTCVTLLRNGLPIPIQFIGRVETLNHDWARLLDHLGVKELEKRVPPR